MTTNSVLKPNAAGRKIEENADPDLRKIRHLIENFNVRNFFETTASEREENNFDNISYTLYIAESR
jgi:hypothetical protein